MFKRNYFTIACVISKNSYIKDRYNKDINSVDELFAEKEANEEEARLKKTVKEASNKLKQPKKQTSKKSKKKKEGPIPENLSFSSVQLGSNGELTKVAGKPFDEWSSSQIRDICVKLGVCGCRANPTKKGMVEALKVALKNKLAVEANQNKKAELCGGRKSRHCPFQLLNVLFCEDVVHEFARIGDTPTRQQLDGKKHKKNQAFWEMVELEFKSVSHNYSTLLFTDDDHIKVKSNVIDPSDIRSHNWEKLRDIYTELQGKCRTTHTNWKRSGNHNPDFMAHCKRLDIHHLLKHLQIHT